MELSFEVSKAYAAICASKLLIRSARVAYYYFITAGESCYIFFVIFSFILGTFGLKLKVA